jgi:hypothetical protein
MIDFILYFLAGSGVVAWLLIGAMYWYHKACMPSDKSLKP